MLIKTEENLKYLLHPSCKIKHKKKHGEFLLIKDIGTSYEISKEIYDFLLVFSKASSKEKAFNMFVGKRVGNKSMKNLLNVFFNEMVDEKILIEEGIIRSKIEINKFRFKKRDSIECFKIIKRISTNGYSEVYETKHLNKKEAMILKCLNLPNYLNAKEVEKYRSRLDYEVKVLQKLVHLDHFPHLAASKVKDLWLVMNKCKGKMLHHFIHQKRLKNRSKWILVQQLVDAIRQLHNRDIIHSDLHYGNVLVDKTLHLSIIDFDQARFEYDTCNTMHGYYPFLAPEQIRKDSIKYIKEGSTKKTDIYQLGILLYYIFYERLPFEAKQWPELYTQIKNGKPYYSSKKKYKKINRIIKMCLRSDPDTREMISFQL